MDKLAKVMPIVTGEAFLQDKVYDKEKCYICKGGIDPFANEDAPLLRVSEHLLANCHLSHPGVVQEYVRQYGAIPEGWRKDA